MSDFTQLPIDEVVTIPAKEEKVFNKQWLKHIRINSTPEKAMVVAHLVPYNGEEILDSPIEQIVVDNILQDIQNPDQPESLRTLKAQTMELILQTIKAEKEYKASLITTDEIIDTP